jgi:hypothetical protein
VCVFLKVWQEISEESLETAKSNSYWAWSAGAWRYALKTQGNSMVRYENGQITRMGTSTLLNHTKNQRTLIQNKEKKF